MTIHNDVELDGKYLGKITGDFAKVSDMLREASQQIRHRGFSDYPIFPISKQFQPIGKLLYEKGMFGNEWHYYVTYEDEFIQLKLIEKQDDYRAVYKNPDEFCCLFVIDEGFMRFLFIPYPED
jgi:hypothetical protein